jgi:hypothetical protein
MSELWDLIDKNPCPIWIIGIPVVFLCSVVYFILRGGSNRAGIVCGSLFVGILWPISVSLFCVCEVGKLLIEGLFTWAESWKS